MKFEKDRKFICPATGLTANLKHCKSFGNNEGCIYLEGEDCKYP